MTKEVQCLLRARDSAFRSGDGAIYSAARANLKRGIQAAKADYRKKIEDCLQSNDSRQVWQGVQHLTSYCPRRTSADVSDTWHLALNTTDKWACH